MPPPGFVVRAAVPLTHSLRALQPRLAREMGRKESPIGLPSEPHRPEVASLSPSSVFGMSLLGVLFGFGVGLLVAGAYGIIILHRAWVGALATGRGPESLNWAY